MIIIAHRGNTEGPMPSYENEPTYIDLAIKKGFDVEVDIWYVNGILYLGHDNPQYSIDFRWIRDRFTHLWIHCKNREALEFFSEISYLIRYFWHQEDDFTLTSNKKIWTYPGKETGVNSVIVAINKEDVDLVDRRIFGVCTDFASYAKDI